MGYGAKTDDRPELVGAIARVSCEQDVVVLTSIISFGHRSCLSMLRVDPPPFVRRPRKRDASPLHIPRFPFAVPSHRRSQLHIPRWERPVANQRPGDMLVPQFRPTWPCCLTGHSPADSDARNRHYLAGKQLRGLQFTTTPYYGNDLKPRNRIKTN